MTLLELLLAVAITSMMALALASVMTGVARGMTSAGDARSALQRAHAAFVRLRAYTEPARCMIQHDPARGFVIWLNDDKPGGTVNLREMRAVWYSADRGSLEVERVVFPAEWPKELADSFDIGLARGSDFLSIMEQERALGYTSTEVAGDGIAGWSLSHEGVTVEAARRVRLTMDLEAGDARTETVLTAHVFVHHAEPR
jgi:hypothetical protein